MLIDDQSIQGVSLERNVAFVKVTVNRQQLVAPTGALSTRLPRRI